MQLSYVQKQSYEICCDQKGYCSGCSVVTMTDIYGDRVYMASNTKAEKVSLDKMKEIIANLKQE